MSATNRGSQREDRDFYETPDYSIFSLLAAKPDLLSYSREQNWLEPAIGNCAIVDAVARYGGRPVWTGVDLVLPSAMPSGRQVYIDTMYVQDFLTWTPTIFYDVCITNPPYFLAQEFIDKARTMSTTTIMLLRLNFFGSQKRSKWWGANIPSELLILSQRPKFINGGSDSCEYAFFIWQGSRPYNEQTKIEVLPPWQT